MITCPTPGCKGILRRIEGMHGPGDASTVHGPGDEMHVRCPECKKLIPWPPPSASDERQTVIQLRPPR